MKKELYLAQVGYYPKYVERESYPKFEVHTIICVCAESLQDAVKMIRKTSLFADESLHAHIDGLQLIKRVSGYDVNLIESLDTEREILVQVEDPWKIEAEIRKKKRSE